MTGKGSPKMAFSNLAPPEGGGHSGYTGVGSRKNHSEEVRTRLRTRLSGKATCEGKYFYARKSAHHGEEKLLQLGVGGGDSNKGR